MEARLEHFMDLAGARPKGGVQRIVSLDGGIAPSARRRAASASWGSAKRSLAGLREVLPSALLGQSPSTISCEISRNGGAQTYRTTPADKQAGMGHGWATALSP